MPIGVILLVLLEIVVYFGLAERMINRMGLSKEILLIFFGVMIVGSFIDIPISSSPVITINLGGAIVPIVLAVYILTRVEKKEVLIRTLLAIVIAGGAIFALTQIYQFEEGHTLIDTNYLFPIVTGVIAYLIGRSRRAAFVAGTLGFLIYDLIHLYRITLGGVPGEADIGGAGAFDSIVISGILAVLLVEILGESRENLVKRDGKINGSDWAHSLFEFGRIDNEGEIEEESVEERGEEDE